jgi:hypothetical protein
LHALVQADIPEQKYHNDTVPFANGQELIVDIEVNPRGYTDVYINDTTGLTMDLPSTRNADRLKVVIALAIEVVAQPNNVNKPITQELMVALEKLIAGEGLEETKVILGWLLNFWTFTASLPKHTHIAWLGKIWKMIDSGKTTKRH